MAPVEHTKWITSTWDCTLGHSCVHWASQLTMDWCAPSKINLKWPKIKQVTNSKLYYLRTYNKFNRSISPVLQNKVGTARAKARYTN